jgi:hypothetical protein
VAETLDPEARAPGWEALAELFVGKDLQKYDYVAIADTLRQSGYSVDELDRILRYEVAPVFAEDLSPLAVPEMQGSTRETVIAHEQAQLGRRKSRLLSLLMRIGGFRSLPKAASDR